MTAGLGNKTMLTVKETAELKGCKEQYIRKMIANGKLKADTEIHPGNRQKQYMIDLGDLPATLQKRYYMRLKAEIRGGPSSVGSADSFPLGGSLEGRKTQKPFDQYTADEREEIVFWSGIVEKWLEHRKSFARVTDADPLYVAALKLEYRELEISEDILYRRLTAYKKGDMDGLIDKRGGWNKGQSTIDDELGGRFDDFYLDDRQWPITVCYEMAKQWAREMRPELVATMPSEQSFRRRAAAIPEPIVAMARKGIKYFDDKWMPYIERLYDELHANDFWIADNHTLDIMTRTGDGETVHRLSFTGFTDALSGVILGGNITDNPCSQSTVLALRNCITKHGIPVNIYVDNGREFLTHDVGGRGHRALKSQSLIEDPPPIFKRLGISMTNAIVKNAKAKNIERTFGTLKNQFSRCFETFTGGNIMEKPESLKYTLKKGDVPLDARIRDLILDWIDIFNNQEYGGPLKKYQGMTCMEVWNESIAEVGMRTTDEANLNLMLLRSTRPQKVVRNGVYIPVCGEKLYYWDKETITKYAGKEVYVRYDPADLSSVRIYDAQTDVYLQTAPMALETMLLFSDTQENISNAQERIRAVKKEQKARLHAYKSQVSPERKLDELYLMSCKAAADRTGTLVQKPTLVIPVYANEEPLKKVSGGDVEGILIDMDVWNRNLERRK